MPSGAVPLLSYTQGALDSLRWLFQALPARLSPVSPTPHPGSLYVYALGLSCFRSFLCGRRLHPLTPLALC